jgi:hypothetical protein
LKIPFKLIAGYFENGKLPAVKVIIDRVTKSLQSIKLDRGKSKSDGADHFRALSFNRIPSPVCVMRTLSFRRQVPSMLLSYTNHSSFEDIKL